MFGAIPRITLSVAITIGGIVAACHPRDPLTPTPAAPEISRNGPRPPAIDTSKRIDAGADASAFGHASVGHREALVRVADIPTDAGVSDVIDLPPIPDADPDLLRDAGTPLAH